MLDRRRTEIAEYKPSDYIFPITALNPGSPWEGGKEQELKIIAYNCIELHTAESSD